MGKTKESVSEKYTTGKGELIGFIKIFEPSTKFNKEGVYSANILLSKEEGKKLAEKIKDIRTKQFKTYGKGTKVVELTRCVPYTTVNEDTGEETPDKEGRYILKASKKAYIREGKPNQYVMVFDSKKNPVRNIKVGTGSVARLGVNLVGYSVAGKTGVSVKLDLVQIIKLIEYSGNNAEAYGLEDEDGFEFDETTAVSESLSKESEETIDDDEDEDF